MKHLILFCGLLLDLSSLYAQTPHEPKEFFLYVKMAGVHQDVETLKELIYPLNDHGEDIQAAIIHNIFNPSEAQRGDGAFSYRAIDSLMAHSDKAGPIDDKLFGVLSDDPFFWEVFKKYKQNNIVVFDYKDAHVILLEGKDGLQLLFWEDLNRLLE